MESHSTPPFVLDGAAAGPPQQRHISREYSNNVDILKVKVDTTFSNGHNEVVKSGDNGDCKLNGTITVREVEPRLSADTADNGDIILAIGYYTREDLKSIYI